MINWIGVVRSTVLRITKPLIRKKKRYTKSSRAKSAIRAKGRVDCEPVPDLAVNIVDWNVGAKCKTIYIWKPYANGLKVVYPDKKNVAPQNRQNGYCPQ